jgi:hypothetical protein
MVGRWVKRSRIGSQPDMDHHLPHKAMVTCVEARHRCAIVASPYILQNILTRFRKRPGLAVTSYSHFRSHFLGFWTSSTGFSPFHGHFVIEITSCGCLFSSLTIERGQYLCVSGGALHQRQDSWARIGRAYSLPSTADIGQSASLLTIYLHRLCLIALLI